MRGIAVGTRKIEHRIFTDEWLASTVRIYPGDLVRLGHRLEAAYVSLQVRAVEDLSEGTCGSAGY